MFWIIYLDEQAQIQAQLAAQFAEEEKIKLELSKDKPTTNETTI
jgi:hypothetical protein